MSLLRRLWRMVEAEVGNRLGGRPKLSDAERAAWEEIRRGNSQTGRRGANQSQQSQSGQSHQSSGNPGEDPELARYYRNLEVPYGSDLATVRDAWKRLMRQYHPDLHSGDPEKLRTATELVKGLNHAYEQLKRHLERRT